MRRLLLGTLLALIPLGAFAAAPPTAGDIRAQVARIESATESLRQLTPTHQVTVVFAGNTAFSSDWATEIRQEQTDAGIELNRRESVAVGFLKKSDNLRRLLLTSSASQVAGFYDYTHAALYVRNDANRIFGAERYVIAHEYTHALQDEHFHLAKLLPDQYPLAYRNSDAVSAHHALLEGDAVNTEILFIHQTYTKKDLSALLKLESVPDRSPSLPSALKRQFLFPYTTGVDYVSTLYNHGGIAAINAAYHRLPASTYEIMHPYSYLRGWKPTKVPLYGVQGFADWQQLDDDVFGAFGYDLLLWQSLGKKTADRVTTAYRGDRYIFLEKGADNAMLLKSVWTDHSHALAAESVLLTAYQRRYPKAHRNTGTASVLHSPVQALYTHVTGDTLTLAYAPNTALATALGSAPAATTPVATPTKTTR